MDGQGSAGRLDELLREVRRQMTRGTGLEPRAVVDWLGRQTRTEVALVAGTGVVQASTEGFPHGLPGSIEPLLARLSGGRAAAAATESGSLHVRLEALGTRSPRPVLVVAGTSTPTRDAASLISHAASVIALLGQARDADTTFHGYQYKARQLRFAVLSALLAGDLTLARRMTTGAVPALLDADRLRVYLLHCPTEDRDRLVQLHQDRSGYHGTGLMAHCPAFKEHLICLVTEDAETGGPHDQGTVLRRLVRENSAYALGISGPYPLDSTAEAYGQALHALAAARTTPDRVAAYLGQAHLVRLLPRRAALAWASTFLLPLDSVPKPTLDITRLAVTFPRSAVARLLDISRNTVASHLKRVETTLGLDLGDVRTRAVLDLAFALTATRSAGEIADREPLPAPALDDVLGTHPARTWARAFLHPLQDTSRRDLRTTLWTWIDANTDAQRAAGRLGVSRNTVRAHLRAAEGLLGRDLLTTGSGIPDVVHALHITRAHPVD
ncbi:helix-turn-helix domain-containing protein [Streptomyces sp. NPDC088124]|uniref:helix-turn-helix domain-containing protein n=1 Tax=Streptomyces sp. NPDC088124 TaxID=3154654 RepID=UPI003413BA56